MPRKYNLKGFCQDSGSTRIFVGERQLRSCKMKYSVSIETEKSTSWSKLGETVNQNLAKIPNRPTNKNATYVAITADIISIYVPF